MLSNGLPFSTTQPYHHTNSMPNSEPEEAAAEATEEAPTTRATRSSKRRPSGGDWPEAKRPKNDNDDNEIKRPTPLEYLEDYVEFTVNLLLPDDAADLPTYHAVPVVSALHYLKHNPKRRKLVWEDWSPYQVCLFEAALAHHGKDFYAIAKEFGEGVKSTQQVIDFYYV